MELHNRDVRTDVRELGALVGDVLSAQASTAAYETVEELRNAAIRYRRGDASTTPASRWPARSRRSPPSTPTSPTTSSASASSPS